jgi:hypothetical protein
MAASAGIFVPYKHRPLRKGSYALIVGALPKRAIANYLFPPLSSGKTSVDSIKIQENK